MLWVQEIWMKMVEARTVLKQSNYGGKVKLVSHIEDKFGIVDKLMSLRRESTRK